MEKILNVYQVNAKGSMNSEFILAHNEAVAQLIFWEKYPELYGTTLDLEVRLFQVFTELSAEEASQFSPMDMTLAKLYAQSRRNQYMIVQRSEAFLEERNKGVSMRQAVDIYGWLGRIINVTNINEYAIIEYEDKHNLTHRFSVLIDGEKTHISWNSFDAALVGAIAYKNEGSDSQAAHYFVKMIGLEG